MADDSDMIGRLVREKQYAEDKLKQAEERYDALLEEHERLYDEILSPMATITAYATTEVDLNFQQDIHRFTFPNPTTIRLSEPTNRLRDWTNSQERAKHLQKLRWILARKWARHAFNTFNEHMRGLNH